jgi:hypothetical protein
MRFEDFTAVKIEVEVCLHLHSEDGGSEVL